MVFDVFPVMFGASLGGCLMVFKWFLAGSGGFLNGC